MLDYSLKLCSKPSEVNNNDINKLIDNGFSEEAIWDIGSITSFFSLSNRMAHHTALLPNNEFYNIARNQ